MKESMQNALLYGGAALILGGIAVAWHLCDRDADVVTLLSSAQVQIQMAYAMPAVDKQGRELSSRRTLIDDAEKNLATVERLEPGLTGVAEGQALVHLLRGDYRAAAQSYHEAQLRHDCQTDQRDVLAFNEARMLAKAGQGEAALSCFAANAAILDVRYAPFRALEEARILRGLGRTDEAVGRVDHVLQDAGAPLPAVLDAGIECVALGLDGKAASAFGRAATAVPIADYHLALLKLRQGQVDTSLELLGRAKKASPAEVGRLLREEAAAWSAVAADARFQELGESAAATPGR